MPLFRSRRRDGRRPRPSLLQSAEWPELRSPSHNSAVGVSVERGLLWLRDPASDQKRSEKAPLLLVLATYYLGQNSAIIQ